MVKRDTDLDTIIIPSQEDVHQGDPLGPTLFATTIHPVIKSIQEKHRDLTVLAYLDDIFVVGRAEQAMFLLSDLKSSLQQLGLQICERKCELYGDSLPRGCTLNVSTTSEGIEVLRIPVGKRNISNKFAPRRLRKVTSFALNSGI